MTQKNVSTLTMDSIPKCLFNASLSFDFMLEKKILKSKNWHRNFTSPIDHVHPTKAWIYDTNEKSLELLNAEKQNKRVKFLRCYIFLRSVFPSGTLKTIIFKFAWFNAARD